MGVSKHYNYDARYPLNYRWPEKVNYLNPITGFKRIYSNGADTRFSFKLQSGDKTDNLEPDEGFENLDWSVIKSFDILFRKDNSRMLVLMFH